MADGRMLSKKISLNEAVASLENDLHRLLFTWGISHLDIDGRISGSPKVFRAIVAPLLEHITSDKVSKFFQDAESKGLILRYQVDSEWFIAYPKFKDNQRLRADREAPSKLPPPPELIQPTPGGLPEDSRSEPAELPEDSAFKLSLSLREVKLREASASTSAKSSGDALQNSVFSCPHFVIEQEYFEALTKEYPGLDNGRLNLEIRKAADWLTDNPDRHKRTSKGLIKNKRAFLRNWLERATVNPPRNILGTPYQAPAREPPPGPLKTPDPKCPICRGAGLEEKTDGSAIRMRPCKCLEGT